MTKVGSISLHITPAVCHTSDRPAKSTSEIHKTQYHPIIIRITHPKQ